MDVNPQILSLYIEEIVPAVCKAGDDEQHGSSVLADITLLQAISKRIHLGKFVAETKFQEAEEKYRQLVMADDVDGVMELLTNRAVEERVLQVRRDVRGCVRRGVLKEGLYLWCEGDGLTSVPHTALYKHLPPSAPSSRRARTGRTSRGRRPSSRWSPR